MYYLVISGIDIDKFVRVGGLLVTARLQEKNTVLYARFAI